MKIRIPCINHMLTKLEPEGSTGMMVIFVVLNLVLTSRA
jgi:hypothetical protein